MELKDRAKRVALPEDSTEEAVITKEKEFGLLTKDGKPLSVEEYEREVSKSRLLQDKLREAEKGRVDAITRAKELEEQTKRGKPEVRALTEIYDEDNFPQTKEEWDDLYDEDWQYATDLRHTFNERKRASESEIKTAAEKIQDEHKDMFLVDTNGDFILDRYNRPQVDPKSEKGKLFLEVVGSDPNILKVKGGLEKMMELTLARLNKGKEDAVKKKLDEEKKVAEDKRQADVKAGGVASGGKTPPPPPKVEVKFNSKEEEEYVEKQIAKGIYKDKVHYCRVRDNKEISYGRGGF